MAHQVREYFQLTPTRTPWLGRLTASAVVVASVALSACSHTNVVQTDTVRTIAPYNEVPISSNFPTSTQLKLQAAKHWANIADDTGKAIAALLTKSSLCNPATRTCTPIFINSPAYITEFSRTFHNQLLTTLVTSGMNVSKSPEAAIGIDIDVQPVFFTENRPQYRYASKATELGPGIWALRDVSSMNPSDPKNSPSPDDALHWFRTEFAAGQTPQTEIVVTVSASDKDRYLARTTNVYYVTQGDARLYNQEICSLIRPCYIPEAAVAAEPEKVGPKPKPTKTIGVTGDCPLEKVCCPADKPCDVEQPTKPKTTTKKKKS